MRIFDDQHKPIGVATRAEVHKQGLWHETFHCWFVSRKDGIDYIYVQLRSSLKKDYPNLLDITAAGHLLAEETVSDGVREIEEELGVKVSMDELIPLGKVDYIMTQPNMIDKEIANVFLYLADHSFDAYRLQPEEVSGIVRTEYAAFCELWQEDREEIEVEGFLTNPNGEKARVRKNINKHNFVPHEKSYYESIIAAISKALETTVESR
ncbi:MAG: isopentenyl-diphosphate delta-isomerase [Paenibacillus sp.]|nr:isopentenyl-diphosphate delta-isomerase [Paenibacillus sp.]